VDLAELRRPDWLALLAVAGQDIDLIEGTVRDNILMARPEANDRELADAIKIAGLRELIAALPDGFEHWVGQEGLRLSGGERQRLGLARAVLRDPQLLILDEAMNALDPALEDNIRAALTKRRAGRTVLLISHRPETQMSAARVVRLDRGHIREADEKHATAAE
jgi:subfamily B ATP-binding cassette protein MsbA